MTCGVDAEGWSMTRSQVGAFPFLSPTISPVLAQMSTDAFFTPVKGFDDAKFDQATIVVPIVSSVPPKWIRVHLYNFLTSRTILPPHSEPAMFLSSPSTS